MNETVLGNPVVDPGAGSSVAALTRTAFNAILEGRRLSRAELVQATGASPEDLDPLVGRALVLDADDRVVAAHGLSLVPARQHQLTLRGRRFWTWCAIDAIGIPAGLDEHALVETTCHQCGTEVRLELHGAAVVQASHPDARIWEAARLQGRGTAGPPALRLDEPVLLGRASPCLAPGASERAGRGARPGPGWGARASRMGLRYRTRRYELWPR